MATVKTVSSARPQGPASKAAAHEPAEPERRRSAWPFIGAFAAGAVGAAILILPLSSTFRTDGNSESGKEISIRITGPTECGSGIVMAGNTASQSLTIYCAGQKWMKTGTGKVMTTRKTEYPEKTHAPYAENTNQAAPEPGQVQAQIPPDNGNYAENYGPTSSPLPLNAPIPPDMFQPGSYFDTQFIPGPEGFLIVTVPGLFINGEQAEFRTSHRDREGAGREAESQFESQRSSGKQVSYSSGLAENYNKTEQGKEHPLPTPTRGQSIAPHIISPKTTPKTPTTTTPTRGQPVSPGPVTTTPTSPTTRGQPGQSTATTTPTSPTTRGQPGQSTAPPTTRGQPGQSTGTSPTRSYSTSATEPKPGSWGSSSYTPPGYTRNQAGQLTQTYLSRGQSGQMYQRSQAGSPRTGAPASYPGSMGYPHSFMQQAPRAQSYAPRAMGQGGYQQHYSAPHASFGGARRR